MPSQCSYGGLWLLAPQLAPALTFDEYKSSNRCVRLHCRHLRPPLSESKIRKGSPESGRVLLRHAAAKCRRSVAYYCSAAYTISYARHRFPPDIIRHAVWLYLRFTLSYRDVEDLLAERGLMVSNESIRRWVLKFGPIIAKNLRAPKPHSRWGMMVSIAGRQMYMWRAVDSEGEVLEILVQPQRDKAAAFRSNPGTPNPSNRACRACRRGQNRRHASLRRDHVQHGCGFRRRTWRSWRRRRPSPPLTPTWTSHDGRRSVVMPEAARRVRPKRRFFSQALSQQVPRAALRYLPFGNGSLANLRGQCLRVAACSQRV